MAWKDVPGMGSENNNEEKNSAEYSENKEDANTIDNSNIPKEQEVKNNENPFEEEYYNESFQIKEESTFDELSPKNTDIRSRNKKVILVSGVAFILFAVFVYIASSSREQPKVVKQEEELKMKLPQNDESLQENTAIYALKKEVEELKYKKGQPEQTSSAPAPNDKIPGGASNINTQTYSDKPAPPPLPPAIDDNSYDSIINQQFPNKTFAVDEQGQPKKEVYKVVLMDNPFQSGTFTYSGEVAPAVYTVKSEIVGQNPSTSQNGVDKSKGQEKLLDSAEKEKGQSKKQSKESKKKAPETFTIPAGSFFKAVLLNGVDAPTGMGGKASPYPVIARVLTDSVLPNRFFADMKGCFVLGEATGELSSERVIMRFTKISCVTKSGKVIEKDLLGFIAGEDGKYGLIGRVVSKAGAQLGRTLLAKFVESAGNILTMQAQTISTSGLGAVTTIKPEEAGQAAVYSGFAGAAKSLSEYYLKLADQIFPVIEINAGRQGDIVLLQNLTINLKSDLKDNGGFIQRDGILSGNSLPEEKVFKIKEEMK